jgi:hypothetical protein
VSALSDALLADLGADDLRALAERLVPHLRDLLGVQPEPDRWLNAKEAAAHLGLSSVHAIHRLTSARQIPFHQDGPGCRCWFLRSELDAWRSR